MLNICICDDEDEILTRITNLIKKIAYKHAMFFNILTYHSGEEMLFDVVDSEKFIDVYFMDVLMDGMNGIEAANKLREENCEAPIVFLTSSRQHVFEALDVMPLHYLVKQDVSIDKIENVLLKAVSKAEEKKREFFAYKTGKILGKVSLAEILFFEVKNRIIDMHLKNRDVVEFYSNMAEIENQLKDSWFVRAHRSFMVNLENVDYLDGKNFHFKSGEVVPIGQKYIKGVKEEYKRFLLCCIDDL